MITSEDRIDLVDLQKSKGKTLLVPTTLHLKRRQYAIEALLDSGASGQFIDPQLVDQYNLPKYPLRNVIQTFNADGTKNASGTCTHFTKMHVEINGHQMTLFPRIVKLGTKRLFLGITWLMETNPDIDWQKPSLRWRDEQSVPIKLYPAKRPEGINTINTVYEEINVKHNTSQQLHNASDQKKRESDPLITVPKKFHQFLKVFNKTESEKLPPRRDWDHKIELQPDFIPKRMPVYHLTPQETNELDKFISENLRKGYIRKSKSPMASSFFFVGKKGGDLRPCQDYRYLNQHTVKNAHPIPSISKIMDQLKDSKYFTKLDVRLGYNNVRIHKGHEWKAAFRTPNGLYEPTVMFFGMTN